MRLHPVRHRVATLAVSLGIVAALVPTTLAAAEAPPAAPSASPSAGAPSTGPAAAAPDAGDAAVTERIPFGDPVPAEVPPVDDHDGTAHTHAGDDHDGTADTHAGDDPATGTTTTDGERPGDSTQSVTLTAPTFVAFGIAVADGGDATLPADGLAARWRLGGGGWSEWRPLHPIDGGEDGDPSPPRTTEPLWVGAADEVEVRGPDLTGLDLLVVHDGRSSHATGSATEGAGPDGPVTEVVTSAVTGTQRHPLPVPVHTRGEWGARSPKEVFDVYPTTLAVVHHTVNANDYGPGDVPGLLRSIQNFHMDGNGWSDIAYNFVVDRFGQVWEGRDRSLVEGTQGAHTKAFNAGSVGIALLGDFTSAGPTTAQLEAAGKMAGWRMATGGIDPRAVNIYIANDGGNELYAAGTPLQRNVVSGHRDFQSTSCPGNLAYSQLAYVRAVAGVTFDQVTQAFGAFDSTELVGPRIYRASGWALDPDAGSTSIGVHLWVDGAPRSATTTSIPRPDLAGSFPWATGQHGWSMDVALSDGWHQLCAYAIGWQFGPGNPQIGCRSVFVDGLPVGWLEGVGRGGPNTLRATGWAIDPDTTGAVGVHVWAFRNGNPVAGVVTSTTIARPDVAARFPGFDSHRGFSADLVLSPGPYTVCAYAIDNAGAGSRTIGCQAAVVDTAPLGSLDGVDLVGPDTVRARGWALDPNTPGPIAVHVWAFRNGTPVTAVPTTTTTARPDVIAAFPGFAPERGFAADLTLAPGDWTICAYGLDDKGNGSGTLGCRSTTIGTMPVGSLDVVGLSGPNTLRAGGWALDPNTAGPTVVHLWAFRNGAPIRSAATTTSVARPDVVAAFPGFAPERGFWGELVLSPGDWTVCAYGIDSGGQGSGTLGCRAATIGTMPIGNLDVVDAAGPGALSAGGWALDPNTAGPTVVHLWAFKNGVPTASKATLTSIERPDVAAGFPGWGPERGFSATMDLPAGDWTVCAYAIDGGGQGSTTIGCRSATVTT